MKALSAVVMSLLLAMLAGCASTGTTASDAGGPPANVAGSWSGHAIGAAGGTVEMTLSQSGPAVTGDIRVAGRPDVSGPLSGTVSGNTVRFKLNTGYGSTGELRVAENTISGVVGGQGVTLKR